MDLMNNYDNLLSKYNSIDLIIDFVKTVSDSYHKSRNQKSIFNSNVSQVNNEYIMYYTIDSFDNFNKKYFLGFSYDI